MTGHVRKRGDKWYYSFEMASVDGKRRRVERVGGTTRKEAEKALRKALHDLDATGIYHQPKDLSFADYLDEWIQVYAAANLKFATCDNYKRLIKNHIKPALGHYALKNLRPNVLQEFLNAKKEAKYAKSTVKLIFAILQSSLAYAVQPMEYLLLNPAQNVKMPRFDELPKESIKTVSKEQLEQILERFPRGHAFHLPILLGYHAGLRLGEALGLEWKHVDTHNKVLKIRQTLTDPKKSGERIVGTPKTKNSVRDVPFGETLYSILRSYKAWQAENKLKYGEFYTPTPYLCTKENGIPLEINDMRYLGLCCRRHLGFEFNYHMLRHTHATKLIEAGADLKDVSKRLGHASVGVTIDTYVHVTKAMEDRTVSILEKVL